jgi:hypothetical protein
MARKDTLIPFALQGHGGQLYYLFSNRKVNLINMSLITNVHSSFDITLGMANATRAGFDAGDPIHQSYFRGMNSFYPESYANHKPVAFYNNKLYQSLNVIERNGGGTIFTRFDGSGIFAYGGQSSQFSGPGTEILNASGTDAAHLIGYQTMDLAHLVYNGSLWMVGQLTSVPNTAADHMFVEAGWKAIDITGGDGSDTHARREFIVNSINIDENESDDKRAGPRTDFLNNAAHFTYNHSCDLVGFKNDLYYATWQDLFRLPQCSGAPLNIESHPARPSAKSFLVYPIA